MQNSMFIHLFGAYFGLSLSKMITPKEAFDHRDAKSRYNSDIEAMVCVVFD